MSTNNTNKKKVIVIGAGVSGLACARELLSRHYEVLVVEARGRPGGRLKGQEVATSGDTSVNIDVGGALIHGIHQNPIYKIARDQMGVATYTVEQDCLLLDSSGNAIDPETDHEISQEFNQCLEETFQQCNNNTTNSREDSFGRVFGKTCRRRNNNDDPQNLLFQWHQSNLELSCGTSFENLGLEWNDDEAYEYQGDHVALPTSWNSVVEGLAEPLTIVYNAPVHSIRIVQQHEQQRRVDKTTTTATSSSPNVTPSRRSRRLQGEEAHVRRSLRQTKGIRNNILSIDHASCLSYDDANATYNTAKRKQQSPTKVEVTLSQNKTLEADAVVCTLPLGVLQIPPDAPGHVEFDPPFSPEKLQAIQNLGSGLLNKCVLTFPYVFWSWDSDFVGVVDDPPQLVLNGARILPNPNHNAVLIWMFGGNQANQVETKSDAQVVEDCLAVLQKLLHAEIPKPLDYVVTRWGCDAYARGAFCFIPPGVAAHDTLEKLCEPIFDFQGIPRICFAGEHTTPYHPSTIHGALNSGVREAYRLDLSLFPKQNQYMEFESNYLYKKTFVVKRKFENTPSVQQRRSGGVKTRSSRMLKNGQHHVATTSSPPPSRRSDRVNKGNQLVRNQQVDRSLLRSHEAFRDWNVVADTVLPIFGCDKSIPQLRARFQHLKSKHHNTKNVDLSMWQRGRDEETTSSSRQKSRRTALLDM